MLSTECHCGRAKNPKAKQCMKCANETRRQKLKGVTHSEERRRNISAGQKLAVEAGWSPYRIGDFTRGKPSPKASPVGAERIVKDGRVQVKCEDGKWRYRSRLVWAAANGTIPRGILIHHDNEDPMDDRLGNLMAVTRAEHARIHSTPDVARERQRRTVEARKRNGSY